jgi:hypothetical protein
MQTIKATGNDPGGLYRFVPITQRSTHPSGCSGLPAQQLETLPLSLGLIVGVHGDVTKLVSNYVPGLSE